MKLLKVCFVVTFAVTVGGLFLVVNQYAYGGRRLQHNNADQKIPIPNSQKKGPDSDSEDTYTQTIAASSPIRNCSLQNAEAGNFSVSDCNRGGYFLSLSYTDQATNAIYRMGSLQCLAGRMEMSVVEPFIHTDNHLSNWSPPRGIATPLRFRDVFNVTEWIAKGQQYSFSPLLMWENVLQTAPRNVILVEIRYKPERWNHWDHTSVGSCSMKEPRRFFSQRLQQHHFRVHHEVCLNFRKYGVLTTEQFQSIVFQKLSPHNSTVVIDEWRGISEAGHYVQINGTGCYPSIHVDFLHFLEPSWTVLQDASTYIRRYLNDNFNYIALMVRWEYQILLNGLPHGGRRCMNITKNYLARLRAKTGLTSVFLTVDVGKYGSNAFVANVPKPQRLLAYKNSEELLHLLYGETMTLSHYEERFQNISQVDRRAYVAVVQKEIAARAKCLILVGTGHYQQHALYMWQSYHPDGETCNESVHEC